ncbi:hypothetical protein N7456_010411 [Penicillium angulare]|uniref:Uncharacterized protein n=1 Tax=Penicillium angulare TaxID=116970 RepID=A0A9W9F6K2_9EURO|nr:hypothetical protein N7456_010411 [Penicillium angulare]
MAEQRAKDDEEHVDRATGKQHLNIWELFAQNHLNETQVTMQRCLRAEAPIMALYPQRPQKVGMLEFALLSSPLETSTREAQVVELNVAQDLKLV